MIDFSKNIRSIKLIMNKMCGSLSPEKIPIEAVEFRFPIIYKKYSR
jgi:hypothetical protein